MTKIIWKASVVLLGVKVFGNPFTDGIERSLRVQTWRRFRWTPYREVENENSSDAALCSVEAPTIQEIALVEEAMEGSEGEAQSEASATSQASSFTKIYAYAANISDCLSSKMAEAFIVTYIIAMGLYMHWS